MKGLGQKTMMGLGKANRDRSDRNSIVPIGHHFPTCLDRPLPLKQLCVGV